MIFTQEVQTHFTVTVWDTKPTTMETIFENYSLGVTDYIDDNMSTGCAEDLGEKFYPVFLPTLYGVIFLLGVVGNGLMITVLLRCRRRLRISEIYLLHLALADLMLLFTLPFKLVDCFTGWIFGEFLCILKGVLEDLNLFCGSLLLACIGFDRYLAIVYAIRSMQSRRPKAVHLTCISLWVFSFFLSLPNVVFLSVKDTNTSHPDCFHYRFEIHANNWFIAKKILNHVCFFFSLLVMSYCYSAIAITLTNSQKSQAKKGAIRLAVLVTLVFVSCWLPFNIASLMETLIDNDYVNLTSCTSKDLLSQALDVTASLGISHCCLNPLLYAFVGVQFRTELLKLLSQLGCRQIFLSESHSRASISEGTSTYNF